MNKDYYRVLGVERTATTQEVKKRYRELAMKYHPDRNPDDPRAAESFREITEAYGVLVDPVRRKEYDARAGVIFDRRVIYEDIFARGDLRDVFEGLPLNAAWIEKLLDIGRIVAYEAVVVGGTPSQVIRRSLARFAAERVTRVFHAVMDIHEHVVIPRSISSEGGYVTVEYRRGLARHSLRVKIPPCTGDKTVLRVRGMGRKNPLRKAGDLYLHVSIEGS
ncbi:MAG TPA: DnaJ domain-containing protein [Deltaproteobacteria bacterium]|nr:DnaJ domain-containing protein [Deltaproteobacteria bacterium]